jgi:ankyrin repeat protein
VGTPQHGHTPLFTAAFQGNVAVAQVLLQAEADKEATDPARARV